MPNQIKVVSSASERVFEEEVNLYLSKGFEIINTEILEKGNDIIYIAILEGKVKAE